MSDARLPSWDAKSQLSPALAGTALVACVMFLVGLLVDDMLLRLVCKPVIHIVLLVWLFHAPSSPYRNRVAVGIVLCMLGDFLLEFRGSPPLFIAGISGFLLGHVAYIAAFVGEERRLHLVRALPFVAWCTYAVAVMYDGVMRKNMLIPVMGYVAAVSTMMWRALARVGSRKDGRLGEWLTVLGAISFAFGDTLIALDRYREPIANVRFPIILTYWPAQLAIVASVFLLPKGDRTS